MSLPEVHLSGKALLKILSIFAEKKFLWEARSPIVKWCVEEFNIKFVDLQSVAKIDNMIKNNYGLSTSLSPIAHLFDFPFERIDEYATKVIACPIKSDFDALVSSMYPIICFLKIPDLGGVAKHFHGILRLVLASESWLEPELFNFVLNSCIVHFISDQSEPFTAEMAAKCFPNYNEDREILMEYVMCNALKTNNHACFEYFTRIIMASDSPNMHFDEMVGRFLPSKLDSFDTLGLDLLSFLCKKETDETILMNAISRMPYTLLQFVDTRVELIANIPNDDETLRKGFRVEYRFDFEESFPDGICPIRTNAFDKKSSYEIPNCAKFAQMRDFLVGLPAFYLNIFFVSFIPTNDTSLLVLMKFLQEFPEVSVGEEILKNIMKSVVFNEAITVFDSNPEFDTVLAVRRTLVNFLLEKHPKSIPILLMLVSECPLLFAEIVGRIHAKLSVIDALIMTDERTLAFIVRVLSCLKNNREDQRCQQARSTIFIFLFDLLDMSDAAKRCFSSSAFVTCFVPCICQPSLNTSVKAVLSKFLRTCTPAEQVITCVELLCAIVGCCYKEEVIIDIIHTINIAADVNQEICKYLSKLVPYMTSFLDRSPTKERLKNVMQFYIRLAVEFDRKDLKKLTALVKEIDGEKISDDTSQAFLAMISNSRSVSQSMMVLIHRYSLVLPFLSLFSSADDARPFFDYFQKLCHYSSYNCSQCNRGELDMLLIEMLTCNSTSFTFRELKFNYVIEDKDYLYNFLCYMVSIVSSPQVALRLIPLMQSSMDFMTKLNSTVANCRQSIIPIGPTNTQIMSISEIKGSDINKEFSIQFWLRMDTVVGQYMASNITIFSIIDPPLKMHVIASGGSIVVRVETGTGLLSAMLSTNFPTNEWSLVTITFKRTAERAAVLSFSLGDNTFDQFTLNIPTFSNNHIQINIGNVVTVDEIMEEAFPIFLSGFTVFDTRLSLENVSEIMRKGSTSTKKLFVLESQKNTKFLNILDILATSHVFQYLLPFFNWFDAFPPKFPEMFLDIVKTVIGYTDYISIDFGLIAHMLQRQKMTYAIYRRLFAILDVCCCPSVINGLVDHILLNFNLWIRCDDINRIVQHLASSLHKSCGSTILSVRSIPKIIAEICYYFYFTKNDPNMPDRNSSIDVQSCRRDLNKLVVALSKLAFTEGDAKAIISHAVHCNDKQSTMCLLELLFQISQTTKIPEKVASLLFYMLKPRNEAMFMLALKIIYTITGRKFSNYCDALIMLMNHYFCTNELFNELLEALPSYPLFFPLLIYVSTCIGDEEMAKTAAALKSLDRSCIQSTKGDWVLLVLLLAARLYPRNTDVIVFISSALLEDFSVSAFDSAIEFIQFFGCLIGIEVEDVMTHVTKVVCDYKSDSSSLANTLFMKCLSILMFSVQNPNQLPCELSLPSILETLEKPPPHFVMSSRLPKSQVMLQTAFRLFQSIQNPSDAIKTFGKYITRITEKQDISERLNEELEAVFPLFFKQQYAHMKLVMNKHFCKLRDFWRQAKQNAFDFCASFTVKEAEEAAERIEAIKRHLVKSEMRNNYSFKQLRKHEMNEFSVWNSRGLFFKETRCCFRYNYCFSQTRLRKSLNDATDNIMKKIDVKQPLCTLKCQLVKIEGLQKATVIMTNDVMWVNKTALPILHIRAVLLRYKHHKRNTLEIIMKTGKTFMLYFNTLDAQKAVEFFEKRKHIKICQTGDPADLIEKVNLTGMWIDGHLNNFEYLMFLNILGGRTFRDSKLYPLFPWLLTHYQQIEAAAHDKSITEISFEDGETRDLSCPIVPHSERFTEAPSNPSIVNYWLGRQSPFNDSNDDVFVSIDDAVQSVLKGTQCSELVPELFSDPEIYGHDFETSMHIVYIQRKLLESGIITNHINEWIDFTFGVNRRGVFSPELYPEVWDSAESQKKVNEITNRLDTAGHLPFQLFKEQHPQKHVECDTRVLSLRARVNDLFGDSTVSSLGDTKAAFVALMNLSETTARFALLDTNGRVHRITTDITGTNAPHDRLIASRQWRHALCAGAGDSMTIFDKYSCMGSEITALQTHSLSLNSHPLCGITASHEIVAVYDNVGTVIWWFIDDHIQMVIPFPCEPIACFAVSSSSSVIVFGTNSGYAYICDLCSHQISFRCDLEGRHPEMVTVSTTMGFIVVYCDDYSIMLFSVNGKFIRRVELGCKMTQWKCAKGRDGFDYLIIADSNGDVRVCELFYLDFSRPIYHTRGGIALLEYDWHTQRVVIVTDINECIVIQHK